ncbi:bifunctional Inositol polyphosphate kinase/Inositol polyphosphate kinase superfamily [Babesia duncani]|uniref:Kinase n=1 Tax=Babesia duncani TaxID=323732 RepID=A0AAD9UNI9_9APIC|nr:bifunctional Inositol polyphosphate kinase/Inositol polyphosphate kinase superfamily [Babesia duncani]
MELEHVESNPEGLNLEVYGREQNKLSGTSLMLKDHEGRFIYKILPENSTTEVSFYTLAYSKTVQLQPIVQDLGVCKHLANVTYLADHNLIPKFEGVVNIIHNVSGNTASWLESKNISNDGVMAIKLEKLDFGYEKPAIIDIKLGPHNVLDTYLGLGAPFTNWDSVALNALLKSWRQQQVSVETTEDDIGFRISSVFIPEDEPICIDSVQAKTFTVANTFDTLQCVFKGRHVVCKMTIECLKKIRNWVLQQDGFSIVASSLLITFDFKNQHICNTRWVDFTHVAFNVQDTSRESKMIQGIDNLMEMLEKLGNG